MEDDEKKKGLDLGRTVADGEGGKLSSILKGERKKKLEDALKRKQRETQPTPEDGMPSLLVTLRRQLEESDKAHAKISSAHSRALSRAGELMRQLEMERGNVIARERRMEKKRRVIEILARVVGSMGKAFEYWEQPAICLVRNQRAAELTGLPSLMFRNHADMSEVIGEIGQVLDVQGQPVELRDLPVTRAFRGEHVTSMLIYVNGKLIDGEAVPVFDPESGTIDCYILYDVVKR